MKNFDPFSEYTRILVFPQNERTQKGYTTKIDGFPQNDTRVRIYPGHVPACIPGIHQTFPATDFAKPASRCTRWSWRNQVTRLIIQYWPRLC